jgi:hypothetical protein
MEENTPIIQTNISSDQDSISQNPVIETNNAPSANKPISRFDEHIWLIICLVIVLGSSIMTIMEGKPFGSIILIFFGSIVFFA